MSKLAAAIVLLIVGVVQGSLYGPFGPFGPFGPQAAQPGFPAYPAFGPSFGPPANVLPPFFAPGAGFPPGFGVPPGVGPQFASVGFPFRSVTANVEPAEKFRAKPAGVLERLAVANLPADLQQRLDELLEAAEVGNVTCDEAYPSVGPFAGLHRRCVVFQKTETERAALALEQEAKDRAVAESAAESTVADVVV